MQAQLLLGKASAATGTLVEQAAAWLQSLTSAMGEHLGKAVCPLWMSIYNNMIAPLPPPQVGHATAAEAARAEAATTEAATTSEAATAAATAEAAAARSDDNHRLPVNAPATSQNRGQKARADRAAEDGALARAEEELRTLRRDREALQQQLKLQSEQMHELRSACEREASALQHRLHQISAHLDHTREALVHRARGRLGDELLQKLLAADRSAAEHLSQARERIEEQHRVLFAFHHAAQIALASLTSSVDSLGIPPRPLA
jgi:DNA repair exonuclease SbcCD ATPase subunit